MARVTRAIVCAITIGALGTTPAVGAAKPPTTHPVKPPLRQVTVNVGRFPSALANDGAHVWVANTMSDTIAELSLSGATVLQRSHIGSEPGSLAITGQTLWVALIGSREVDGFTLGTLQRIARVRSVAVPSSMSVSSGHLFVTSITTNMVTEFDPRSGHLQRSFSSGGTSPVASSATSTTLVVANQQSGTLAAFSTSNAKRRWSVFLGGHPTGVLIAGSTVFVTLGSTGAVVAVALSSGAVVAHYPTSCLEPSGIASTFGRIYVACSHSNLVMELDAKSGKVLRGLRTGVAPSAVLATPHRLFVTNQLSGSVTSAPLNLGGLDSRQR